MADELSIQQILDSMDGLNVPVFSRRPLYKGLKDAMVVREFRETRRMTQEVKPQENLPGDEFEAGAFQEEGVSTLSVDTTYPPKTDEFVKSLEALLTSTGHYPSPDIQSIKRLNNSSIPRWEVSFTYAGLRRGRIFIKDFNGNEALRLKAAAIPNFLAVLGVPTAAPIGYVPGEGFDHRFAFLEPTMREGVVLDKVGEDDLYGVMDELGREKAIEVSCTVLNILANMNVVGTKNKGELKQHKLEVETLDRPAILQERLFRYLDANPDAVKAMARAAKKLDTALGNKPNVLLHGDFKPRNVRIGEALDQYYMLDWEMARIGYPLEDLAMYTLCALRDTGSLQGACTNPDFFKRILADFSDSYLHSYSLAGGIGLTREGFEQSFLVELIFGHLNKLGDQVWTLERFGNKEERHTKGSHHYSQFQALCDYASKAFPDLEPTIKDLKKTGIGLVKSSQKLEYLH